MKKILAFLTGIVVLATCFAGCAEKKDSDSTPESTALTEAVSEENLEGNASATEKYSQNFHIEYLENDIKKVTDGDGRELILVPKVLGKIPEEYADCTVITTPVENAVYMSSTQVCMLRAANDATIWDKVGAVSSDASSFTGLDGVIDGLTNGTILNVGGMMGDPDYEQIQMLQPDVVFVYTGDYGQQGIIEKLNELGIQYAVDNEFLETDYLARMEWMRFILAFYNKEAEADAYMTQAEEKITAIQTQLQGVEPKKVAMFSMYDGVGYGTGDDSWNGHLLADVGGKSAFAGMTEYSYTAEKIFDCVSDADVIIYTETTGMCDGLAAIEEAFPQIKECAAYQNGNIYQLDDKYWNSVDQTDVLAEDLAAVIYPEQFSDHTLHYYVKLAS